MNGILLFIRPFGTSPKIQFDQATEVDSHKRVYWGT